MPAAWHSVWQRISRARAHLWVALAAALAAVLFTWPLAKQAGVSVLGAIYFWDAYANTMIMGSRVDAALGLGPLSLYDAYYFAPLPRAIVFNENHFGLSLLFTPFYLLGGPIWGYNLTLLTSLGLSVFFTHLLVHRLTGSAVAGLVSGIAFAFCPYVMFEIGRIQLVATQWIPACFLLLHRAVEGQKRRDIVLFWLAYLLQIGTCLYYAMFLMPLLGLLGACLLLQSRPGARFYAWFGGAAAVAGGVAGLMVYPYFAVRRSFDLERALSFASSYDGKLDFFTNVSERSLTWTALEHRTWLPGAPEEIAFPGALVLVLATLGLVLALVGAARSAGGRALFKASLGWLVLSAASVLLALVTRSFLPGLLTFVLLSWLWTRRWGWGPFLGTHGAYLAVLLLSVALFLGIEPLEWNGQKVRGLYYYLYTYFPGFDGIRKVSRQAIMAIFALSVLASFGTAWLFARLRAGLFRGAATALLLGLLAFDLRSFPYPVERVWAADETPNVLRFVRELPEQDLIALAPQSSARRRLHDDGTMAFHNYLALLHKHRFVNGQSSFQPPVTELARRSLDALPDDAARRALLAIGTRHLVVFGEDLPRGKASWVDALAARPEQYRVAFREGPHAVLSLLGADDPSLALLDVPQLPAAARLVPSPELRAHSSWQVHRAPLAVDGNLETFWSTARAQEPGQTFEVELQRPRSVRALEILVPGRVFDAPASFRITAARGALELGVVAEQPLLRLYQEQVFSPKTFVWRVVLPEAVLADRLRLTLGQGVPGFYFSIHELRVYAE